MSVKFDEKYIAILMFLSSIASHVLRSNPTRRSILRSTSHRSVSSISNSVIQTSTPPKAKKSEDLIYFGVNPRDKQELRGDHPMDPPKVAFFLIHLFCLTMLCRQRWTTTTGFETTPGKMKL